MHIAKVPCYNGAKLTKKNIPTLSDVRKTAERYLAIAEDHKAIEPKLLDVSQTSGYADFILVLSATSDRHARSLADAILETTGGKVEQLEGYQGGEWVLLDLGNIVVHVFQESAREYYNVDRLWGIDESERRATPRKTMFVSL